MITGTEYAWIGAEGPGRHSSQGKPFGLFGTKTKTATHPTGHISLNDARKKNTALCLENHACFVCTCTQFLRYLVDEDAIEDVQGAQHSCDRVCVYCLTTASIRVSPLRVCATPC